MEQTLKIYYTSDTHGHVFPSNYAAHTPEASGLLNLAAQIEKDGNTLVLDGGDSLQGTPLVQYYLAHASEWPLHPVAAAFNAMGCDYFTLGNHDFNFGYEALRDYLCAMQAQCLCANVVDLGGQLPLRPWTVHTLQNGLRVGLTGVVTDYVNVWEQPQNMEKLQVTDALTAARQALAQLRGRCDVYVCLYHGGFEEDLQTGKLLSDSGENLACRLARELDFELLLTGHQHMPVEAVTLGRSFAVQPPANAGQYILIDGARADGGWQFRSRLLPVGERTAAAPYQALLPLEQAVQRWLDEPVGCLQQDLPAQEKLTAALHGDALADLFNQVQLAFTGADVACSSLGNEPTGLGKNVTMRSLTAAYQFANTLVTIEVTEEVLRTALERCASYFALQDGRPVVSDLFLKPKIEHYNYDFYAGLAYTFDLRRPVGQRVTRLTLADGSPITGPLRLATSNYRATGTGGYEALGRCPVVSRSNEEMPALLAEYIRSHTPVPPLPRTDLRVIWTDESAEAPL